MYSGHARDSAPSFAIAESDLVFILLFLPNLPFILANIDRYSAFFEKAVIRDRQVLVPLEQLTACTKG